MARTTTDPGSLTEADIAGIQRRTLAVVVMSQVLGGAGLAAGITVGALLAQDMLGSEGLAGLPAALFTLGSALAAMLVGRITQRWGRRLGLGFGFAAGGLGAIGVVAAAALGNAPLLFAALFVYGSGTATNLQARYAGTDLAPSNRRATAVSIAMVSTTLGAVAGPNLVEPLGGLAEGLGLPSLSGPFLLAAVAYLAASAALLALLRPDPYLLARGIEAVRQREQGAGGEAPAATPRVGMGAYVGAVVMVVTQISMVAIMTMTPVHMRAHHHGLGAVGLVIGLHVGAMYLPSLVTGRLVDRWGRTQMAVLSGITLLAAGVIAALAPGDSVGLLIVALVLLGFGWNFGLISGTALVVDATVPANRPRTQGAIDVFIALGGAVGGALSGVLMAATSFVTLSIIGGLLSLLLVPVLLWAKR
ncbi:putative MFS family arabinose efflux permease [Leucobacter komagatae]|uniref:Putative MFS family arabinose efflux permease n=1 Tax=Leucobacter komagatae TaxID=55969 RepID=A0A542XXZ2_9MICO|nr:MFS transporter [Leucobacter komagatae]TQL40707.1 putative MFS family arabinose efflux permease [Leucobacter komagatae]